MNYIKIVDLPLELDKVTRVKVINSGTEYVTFMHRNINSENEFTIEKPKNKSWKKIKFNQGEKINIKLTGGIKKPQLILIR